MNDKEFFNQFKYDPEKDLLGSGGFGTVYRAYDKREKRYVAIKISQVKDIFGKFTLLNEVELSKSIDDHTNVARYEFGLRVMYPFPVDYAVMAYYEEGNLDMLLRQRNGQFGEKEFYEIVYGLLEGIGHLHNENIIHRDLKLANILMHRTKQGQWRPKIADFGLSRQMDGYDASVSNSAIGITVAYAAPEQIENKPIRKNVDLWAFGVILYRLSTGEMPFAATAGVDVTSANLEISRKITQMELPEKLASLPEPYQAIIKRCWVKDTKERVQEAAELVAILKSKNWSFNTAYTQSATGSSNDTQPEPIETGTKAVSLEHHIEEVPPSAKGVLGTVFEPILDKKSGEKSSKPQAVVDETIVENPSGTKQDKTPSTPQAVVDETIVENPSGTKHDKTPSKPQAVVDETIVENPSGSKQDKTPTKPKGTVVEKASKSKKTLPTPSVPKADEGETLIETPSESKKNTHSKTSTLVDATLIDNPSQTKKETISPTSKAGDNKRRMAIGGILLCFLLGFGICKFLPKQVENTASVTGNTTVPPTEGPIMPSAQGTTPAPNQGNTTGNATTNPSTAKPNQPNPANPKPTNPSNSNPDITQPTTVSSGNTYPTNTPVASSSTPTPQNSQPQTPKPNEQSPVVVPDKTNKEAEKTIKEVVPPTPEPKAPITQPTPSTKVDAPKLNKKVSIVNNVKCDGCFAKCNGCSEDFDKGGTITISNFNIDNKGKITKESRPTIIIKNHKGETSTDDYLNPKVLEVIKKRFEWDKPQKESHYFNTFSFDYN